MTPNMLELMKHCDVPVHYDSMHKALSKSLSLQVDLRERDLSHALYVQLCQIKLAAWRHKVDFKRARRHSLADIFQDLVAYYFRAALPPQFDVRLEEAKKIPKGGKNVTLQPDICIRLNGRLEFIVEVKTTIGWARPDYKSGSADPYAAMADRIHELATSFDLPEERILYIFEEPTNVHSKLFLPRFWDAAQAIPAPRPTEGVLSHIYPLYMTTDPFYWDDLAIPHGRAKENWFPELPDELILARAKRSVVTPFEDILALILASR